MDILEARYASSEIELEALRAQVDCARSESSSLAAEADSLRTQLDATEAESEILRQGLKEAVAEASAARAEAGKAAQEARELLAEGLRAAYGQGALGVGLGGTGVETSQAVSSLPNTPSNRPVMASSPVSDAAAMALKAIPAPWEQQDVNLVESKESEGDGEGRWRLLRLEEEKEELLVLVASLESHVSLLEGQVASLELQLTENQAPVIKSHAEEMTREERERVEQLAAWRPDVDIALLLSDMEALKSEVEEGRRRLESSQRESQVRAQEVKAARALAYDLSSEVDALRSREADQQGRVDTLLSEVDHYKARPSTFLAPSCLSCPLTPDQLSLSFQLT